MLAVLLLGLPLLLGLLLVLLLPVRRPLLVPELALLFLAVLLGVCGRAAAAAPSCALAASSCCR